VSHADRAVDLQEPVESSVLAATRAFLAWRRGQPLLRTGTIRFLRAAGQVLQFAREDGAARLVCAFNLGDAPQRCRSPCPLRPSGWISPGSRIARHRIELEPWGFALAEQVG
jgi:alpha-glucosidase